MTTGPADSYTKARTTPPSARTVSPVVTPDRELEARILDRLTRLASG